MYKHKTLFFILCISLISFIGNAQTCIISGNAGTYAGDVLKFYRYTDYITQQKKQIGSSKVDSLGNFSFEVETDKIFELLIDLDVFLGSIFVEPGKEFTIVLPKKTVKNKADLLNPYFQQIPFFVRVINEDKNLTNAISKFNRLYNASFDVIFKNPKHINPGVVEQEIEKITDSVSYMQNDYFEKYAFYKFLHLRQLTYYKNDDAVIKKNFSNQAVLFNNPAYNKLLTKEYGTFMFEENKDTLYKVLNLVNDWNSLNNFLIQDDKYLNKEFREYFLCLNMYKVFYTNPTYQKKIIHILKSSLNTIDNEYTKKIANAVLKSSGTLIIGSAVKDFDLYNQNKERVALSEFRGEFVYLSFFKKDSYACQKDQILLEAMHKKKIDKLRIITIYVDEEHRDIINLAKEKNLERTILHCYENDDVLQDYKVIAYPTYFLIHPKGTLSMNPAPGPSEDFEAAYYKAYNEHQRQLVRENY